MMDDMFDFAATTHRWDAGRAEGQKDGCTAKHTCAWRDTEAAAANAALRWNTLVAVDSRFAPIHSNDTRDRGRKSDRSDCKNATESLL